MLLMDGNYWQKNTFLYLKLGPQKMFEEVLTPSELGCFLSHKKALTEFWRVEGNGWWFWKMTFAQRKMLNIWTK